MNYLYLCLLSLNIEYVLGKTYKHTNYYYNNTQCGISPYKIEFITNNSCNTYNNICLYYPNSSVFIQCELIHANSSYNNGSIIILTLLISLILFMLYKVFCVTSLDVLCVSIKDYLDKCLCPIENPNYKYNYSDL